MATAQPRPNPDASGRPAGAAARRQPPAANEALEAFNRLQASLGLDEAAAAEWAREVRRERRASRRPSADRS